ncbi:MAG: L,D-transpeptidase family protein [Clostridia bacterium]|nr:L,D-transpeptidase family protein [Clostridia bacterium]
MNKRWLSLLILLCVAMGSLGLAEEITAMPVEESVEEVSLDLGASEAPAELDECSVSPAEAEVENEPVDDGGEAAPVTATDGAVEDAPQVSTEPEGPAYFTQALKPNKIRLTKASASKSVYLFLPYRVTVKGETVASYASSNKKIAKVSRDGTLTLRKTGSVSITATTESGKAYVLNLKVVDGPAPKDLTFTATKHQMRLNWSAAKYATGYLVEYSYDGKNWSEYVATDADTLTRRVTKVTSGTTWFRVRAIFGDHLGGVSDAVTVLTPVTDVKVIYQETFTYGPADRMNITWSPSPGAVKYAVYRTSLPSTDYELIGTTKNTWYPDRMAPTKLYAYRVMPVWNDQYNAPLSDPVHLYTGWQSNVLPPSDMTSSTGGIIVVNKRAQVVTVYIKDEKGNYTLPLRHMICSTGLTYERTRNGVYKIERKLGEWYTYPGPSGDTIRWPSVYRSGYYFHSPLFNRDHTIRYSTINRLGQRASAGCVRLPNNDAEWVYRYCPVGTTVYICDGEARNDLRDALKPKTVKVQGF